MKAKVMELLILHKGAQARYIRDHIINTERSHMGMGDLRTEPKNSICVR
jgi:hypothetical protein